MRLKIIKWLESSFIQNVVGKEKLGRINLNREAPDHDEAMSLRTHRKELYDYRLSLSVRSTVEVGEGVHARKDIFKIMCRELYGDLTKELMDLDEWVYLEGYGEELRARLRRIILLTRGEDV